MADTSKGDPRPNADGIEVKTATLANSKKKYKNLMTVRREALKSHRKNLAESVQISATDLAVRINVRG